jgi:hypothetical protein
MLESHQIEQLIGAITAMNRAALTEQITRFRAPFPVDFTPEYLDKQHTDRLRHILVALCMQYNQVVAGEIEAQAA